ncbi:hypothetical protein IGI39_004856 [Enterococcus sp. AZ135]|uniref:hypothetical protein n=1 Tax=unclassified Enterococcus TaxID=2608891 RepID=UPI003F1FF7BF
MIEGVQSILILCGIILLIFGSLKKFKSIGWTIKLGVILLILGESTFIISFFQGFFQGIIG